MSQGNYCYCDRKNNLIVFADEIYDKVLYDDKKHTSVASLADDVLFVTLNGLSKNYRACGYRAGWLIVSGDKRRAKDYLEGLNILASIRLCSNVPGQLAIQTAFGGYQSINDLVLPTGRLGAQLELAYNKLINIPGVSCVNPKGAIYLFPKLDEEMYVIEDDEQFALDLLLEQKILLLQIGRAHVCTPVTDQSRMPSSARKKNYTGKSSSVCSPSSSARSCKMHSRS